MVPRGFWSVTRRWVIASGHLWRQMIGLVRSVAPRGMMDGPGNQMPPAPIPEASWWPSATGRSGMSSAILVGCDVRLVAIHLKSRRAAWTPF